MIKYNNNTINKLATDATVNKMYYGSNVVYLAVNGEEPPTPFSGKYKFTLSDDSVVSGECDASSAITSGETSAYQTTLKEVEIGDCATSIGNGAFSGCTSLTNIDIPDSVTSIGRYTFDNCSRLISVTIGSGVTSIGDGAFTYCFGLASVTVNAITPPTLGKRTFYKINNFTIYVPAESVNAYKTANVWSNVASRIQAIPS